MLPELFHWFGLTWADIEAAPMDEIAEFVSRLGDLPPIGGVIQYEKKG